MAIAFDRYALLADVYYVDLATGRRVTITRLHAPDDDWRRRWRMRVGALMTPVNGMERLIDAGDDGARGVFEVREAGLRTVAAPGRQTRLVSEAVAWLRDRGLCAGPCLSARVTAAGCLAADIQTAWPIETPAERAEARRQFHAWTRRFGAADPPSPRRRPQDAAPFAVDEGFDRRAGLVRLDVSCDDALRFARRSGRLAIGGEVEPSMLTREERRRSAVLIEPDRERRAVWSVALAVASARRHYFVPAARASLIARERAPAYGLGISPPASVTTMARRIAEKAAAAAARHRLAEALRLANRALAQGEQSPVAGNALAIKIGALRCQGLAERAWGIVEPVFAGDTSAFGFPLLVEIAECAIDCGHLERGEAFARAAAFSATTADQQRRARDALDRARLWRGEPPEGQAWRARAVWLTWGSRPHWPERGQYAHAPCGVLARWEWLCDSFERALWCSDEKTAARLARTLVPRKARLPPLLRARVDWLASGSPVLARRLGARAILQTGKAEAHMEILEHLSTLLAIAQDGEPESALRQAAAGTRRILRARSLAIFVADRALPRFGDGDAWNRPSPAASRAIATITPVELGTAAGRDGVCAAAPIRAGIGALGAFVAEWPSHAEVDGRRVRLLLEAAALAVSPVLRVWMDTATAPPSSDMPEIVGVSPAMAAVREAIRRVARVPFPVLVEGESGAGKELIARAIHRLSPRAQRPFRALNCAAMAEELVEGELFGHAQGAFTGAVGARAGLFEDADRGTLFLDEVSELSARAQAKLLRVLQESEVRRVGETTPRRIDVRIIAASNRPLREAVDGKAFRADLLFRLDVLRVDVPPLRARPEDIAILAAHFWREAASRAGTLATLASDVTGQLARYAWPGNVRELQNVMAALAVAAPRRGVVAAALLPPHIRGVTLPPVTLHQARATLERDLVRGALARAGGRPGRAAAELGVSRQGLAKLMRRLGLPAA